MKPSRRRFLETGALAGAALGLARPGSARLAAARRAGARLRRPGSTKPMRWAQLTLVEDDPVKFDVGFWLDYFRAHALGRRLPERRRLRRLLPDAGSLPSPQRLARRAGRLRRARRRLPQARDGRRRAHRPARDLRRRAGRASRLDRGRRRRAAAPALGLARDVGDLRPRPLQLRVHDRGDAGDRLALPGGRHLHQPLDGLRHVLLPALRRRTSARRPARSCRGSRRPKPRPAQPDYLLWRQQRALRAVAALGRRGAQDQPRRLRHPQHRRRRHEPARHEEIGERAAMMVADRQARSGLQPPWAIGMNAKEYRATLGRKPVVGPLQRRRRGGLPLEGLGAERRTRSGCGSPTSSPTACGPWFSKFAGTLHDPRWLKPVEEIYVWCHGAERYLRNERPLARVGPRLLAADRLVLRRRARRASGSRIPRSAGTRRSSRRASRSRWCTTGCSTPRSLAPLADADPAERRGALGRAVRAAARLRARAAAGSWRRPRRRSATSRAPRATTSAWPISSAPRSCADVPGPVRNAYLRLEHETRRGPPAARGPRGRPAHHPRRLARST